MRKGHLFLTSKGAVSVDYSLPCVKADWEISYESGPK